MGKTRAALGTLAACLALTAAFSAALLAGAPAGGRTQAFDFELVDINPRSATHGRSLSLLGLRAGRGVVLHFVASWCKPCRDELPGLQRLYEEGDVPLVFVAADESGMRESVLIVAERAALTVPILFAPEDRAGVIAVHYDHEVLPATYFIDARGTIRSVHEGAMSAERLARAAATELGP
jgi:thiol-disulfide isomerase/thioredoxin